MTYLNYVYYAFLFGTFSPSISTCPHIAYPFLASHSYLPPLIKSTSTSTIIYCYRQLTSIDSYFSWFRIFGLHLLHALPANANDHLPGTSSCYAPRHVVPVYVVLRLLSALGFFDSHIPLHAYH